MLRRLIYLSHRLSEAEPEIGMGPFPESTVNREIRNLAIEVDENTRQELVKWLQGQVRR